MRLSARKINHSKLFRQRGTKSLIKSLKALSDKKRFAICDTIITNPCVVPVGYGENRKGEMRAWDAPRSVLSFAFASVSPPTAPS